MAASPTTHSFSASLPGTFREAATEVFQHQYARNALYRQFADLLGRTPASVKEVLEIPFLPVHFFKTHRVVTGPVDATPQLLFRSSGTSGAGARAEHVVLSAARYEAALTAGFGEAYGSPEDWCILALLPSYLERQDASLVHMARMLMARSGHPDGGFYLDDFARLASTLRRLEEAGQQTLLLGVTFALIDFAEAYPQTLRHTTVMETGGMKGRREEWTRREVHDFLKARLGLPAVHSEYGMTELLSQAYAAADGLFRPSSTMRVFARDEQDPLDVRATGRGALNIIDLANHDSCAFLATEDLGIVHVDGCFEVIGRMDHSALRGCSLMTA